MQEPWSMGKATDTTVITVNRCEAIQLPFFAPSKMAWMEIQLTTTAAIQLKGMLKMEYELHLKLLNIALVTNIIVLIVKSRAG